MREFIDEIEGVENGTPLNRDYLMAIQGFDATNIQLLDDKIIETNSLGQAKTTIFNDDGSITEVFVGEKTITKNTIFSDDGIISEVIS